MQYFVLMQKKINKINRLLIQFFGIPKRNKKNPDPVDMLIGTILSQNTNDKNSYRAYQNLRQKYKSWDEVAKLTPSNIERVIRVAGLGKQKSNAINNVLKGLKNKNGKINLNNLYKQDDKSVIDELTAFDGVGIKNRKLCIVVFNE